METSLHNHILERLLADDVLEGLAVDFVDAACQGPTRLEEVLEGKPFKRERPTPNRKAIHVVEPPGAYLESIVVEGFRGVGPEAKLSLTPGPGLTLVVGRNGSGKSTFAEALETLLTGQCGRWSAARSKLWRQGWRNLHAQGGVRVHATVVVEGRAPIRLTRRWEAGTELDGAVVELDSAESFETLGWAPALSEFRPFISHPELGILASEPSHAFDHLHQVLGLGEVSQALGLLTTRRQSFDARAKALKSRRDELVRQAQALAQRDARAERILTALSKRPPAVEVLEHEIRDSHETAQPDSEHRLLGVLSNLQLPSLRDWEAAAAALRQAAAEVEVTAADSAADHSKLAQLLEAALPYLERNAAACPVCERPIGPEFVATLAERTKRARALSQRFEDCQKKLHEAQRVARTLADKLPEAELAAAEKLGLVEGLSVRATELRKALQGNPGELAAELEATGLEVAQAGEHLRVQAAERLRALDDAFRPLQRNLIGWLSDARQEEPEAGVRLKALKAAEKWLQGQEAALRDERFQPIADEVKEIWQLLGQQSSVTLDSVQLAGKRTTRRLDLGVSVDGAGSAAVGVMSQGELNALALSLFLPRMMLIESPFRFLVIDDPVQAMDPLKVDGLARVLEKVARARQVVVFTHDPRLVEAVQRLQIPATVLEVTRRARSNVEVRVTGNATTQYLSDARHVASKASAMGETLVRRVVPGFCRSAVEAACLKVVRCRRLGRGDFHEELEEQLRGTTSLLDLMAMALFDDQSKAMDVLRHLNREGHRECADTLQAVRAGAHGNFKGDASDLVRATQRLTDYLDAQT
jgi:ABC-type Mn2+/Zn2+ transport system ATPase subunit